MSAPRPVRAIRPPAKFAEDASDFSLGLVSRHKAATSTTTPLTAPSSPTSGLHASATLTDFEVGSSPDPPTRTATKRPLDGLTLDIDDDANSTDVAEDAPKTKKSKKVPNRPAPTALQNEASIIDIDDVDDMKNERLNKSDATADLKEFFIAAPRAPGQDKAQMRCKLCE